MKKGIKRKKKKDETDDEKDNDEGKENEKRHDPAGSSYDCLSLFWQKKMQTSHDDQQA